MPAVGVFTADMPALQGGNGCVEWKYGLFTLCPTQKVHPLACQVFAEAPLPLLLHFRLVSRVSSCPFDLGVLVSPFRTRRRSVSCCMGLQPRALKLRQFPSHIPPARGDASDGSTLVTLEDVMCIAISEGGLGIQRRCE